MTQQRFDLTRFVGRLECGPERGTAFFLSVDLAVTCRHCVLPALADGAQIVIHAGGRTTDVALAEPTIPIDHDTVLLRLATPVPESWLLPLAASHLPPGSEWETFGFPLVRAHAGMALTGVVAVALQSDTTPSDVELRCVTDPPTSFKGFSGSPVVLDGAARAVLQVRHDGGLGAISLWKLQGYLASARITLRTAENEEPLPTRLRLELDEAVPNLQTRRQLEASFTAGGGYVLLGGNPGSGKTLLIAGFRPALDGVTVVGRYFASGHAGSDLPASFHGRLATFARWLSNEAGLLSRETVAATPDSPVERFATSVVSNLKVLSGSVTGGRTVLLIDGAEPEGHSPTELIQYLPKMLPSGLTVAISTTNPAAFRARFPELPIAAEVTIRPLPLYDCEWLATRKLHAGLSPSEVTRLAQMSQGHPLTLAYLIQEVSAAVARGEANPLESINPASPGLAGYYAAIWARLSERADAQYLLSLIARLRQRVTESQLIQMLPPEQQTGLPNALVRVRHLLRSDGGTIRLYHESFRDFVLATAPTLDVPIHTALVKYCESYPAAEYALTNGLYHRMRAEHDPQETARQCNQEWVDRAATACVPPELILSDIDAIRAERLRAGDLLESIRLLLLHSRNQSRYNHFFAFSAARFARAAAGLRSARQALVFLVRDGLYLCDPDDTLLILRDLSLGRHHPELFELFQEFRRRCWIAYEQGADYGVLLAHMRATCVLAASGNPSSVALVRGELQQLNWLFNQNQRGSDEVSNELMLSNAWGAIHAELLWRMGYAPCDIGDPVELASTLEEVRTIASDHGFVAPIPAHRVLQPENGPALLSRAEIGAALVESVLTVAIPRGAEELIASELMRVSDAFARVGELCKASAQHALEVSLRSDDGVGPDLTGLRRVLFAHEITGFVADPAVPPSVTWSVRHEWERRFLQAAEWLGALRGRGFRARALGQALQAPLITALQGEFFPRLRFSLCDRARWEDSYHIPEYVVPRLILFAAEAVAELEPASSEAFARCILDHPESQAGLYSEGYQRLLTVVANVLSSTPQGEQPAADLRRTLRAHLTDRVFARRERVAGLLDCAQHLARLGSEEDAEGAFKEAIDSSLGPTWYKEDQFRLVLDAVEAVGDQDFSRSQWRRAVEILAFASGESTFQRFVRHEKERLVQHLAASGLLAEALHTYRHYITPSLRLQRARVTRVGIDMASGLAGDRFGVLEIDEQSGAIALLSAAGAATTLRRWAVLELFWPWGDDRYATQFAGIFCGLLATGSVEVIGERFLRLLRADVEPDRRAEFCAHIARVDSENVAAPWLGIARGRGIVVDPDPQPLQTDPSTGPPNIPPENDSERDPDDLLFPGLFGRRASLAPLSEARGNAQGRLARGDRAGARTILINALRTAQLGGWDVWDGHGDADEAMCRLFGECGPNEAALRGLAELVLEEEHAASWRVARRLVLAAVRTLNANDRRHLFATLVEHVECLVRPERRRLSVVEELDELPDSASPLSANVCLDTLLLSQLDHPNAWMRRRAATVVEWLVRAGELSPNLLVDRVRQDGFSEGREIAVGILHRLTIHSPAGGDLVAACDGFDQMTRQDNCLVRYLVEETGRSWHGTGAATPAAVHTVYTWSSAASEMLEVDVEARARASNTVAALCGTMSPAAVDELINIRHRAFDAPHQRYGASALEREAIFRSLADLPGEAVRQIVASFASWNPLWPDADFRVDWGPVVPNILAAIASGNVRAAFRAGDKTILHCLEIEPPQKGEEPTIVEVVAVLVPNQFFQGRLDLHDLWEEGATHQRELPPLREPLIAMLQEHAIVRYEPQVAYGGDFTPAFPSRRLVQLLGEANVERICWRDGRRWDAWGPGPELANGIATLVDSGAASSIVGYDLVWVVIRDELPLCIVDPRRNQTHRINYAS